MSYNSWIGDWDEELNISAKMEIIIDKESNELAISIFIIVVLICFQNVTGKPPLSKKLMDSQLHF